ncbi:MAG: cobalamin-dependent protein [Acidobacteriota bacterium]
MILETTAGRELARELDARRAGLAGALTDLHYERRPELAERYGPIGRERCLEDAAYHLTYLAEALAAGAPDLFADYVAWAKVMLEGRGIPASDLSFNLETLRDVLRRELPAGQAALAAGYVEEGLARLPQLPSEPPPAMPPPPENGGGLLGGLAAGYLQALLRGERHVASRLVLDAVESGVGVKDVYLHVFQHSQHEIGRLWQMNRLSVAQEHYCTAATQLIMSQLYPYIFNTRRNDQVLVATCVAGDLHEIGVRMVSDFFEIEGWDTFYLGANTPTASLIQTLREREADVLAVSATMAFHLRSLAALIAAVRASDVGERVRILVGGYPFNIVSDLWRLVGADAVARDAEESVAVAERLVRSPERPS